MIGILVELLLSASGLFTWWLLHAAVDPHVIRGIPAPRVRYDVDYEIHPLFNDWRGFT